MLKHGTGLGIVPTGFPIDAAVVLSFTRYKFACTIAPGWFAVVVWFANHPAIFFWLCCAEQWDVSR